MSKRKHLDKFDGGHLFALLSLVTAAIVLIIACTISARTQHWSLDHRFCRRLLVLGLAIDIASPFIFIFAWLTSKQELAIPIVGWVAYTLVCMACANPLLFTRASGELGLTQLIVLKVAEFFVLTIFHFVCQFVLPRLTLFLLDKK